RDCSCLVQSHMSCVCHHACLIANQHGVDHDPVSLRPAHEEMKFSIRTTALPAYLLLGALTVRKTPISRQLLTICLYQPSHHIRMRSLYIVIFKRNHCLCPPNILLCFYSALTVLGSFFRAFIISIIGLLSSSAIPGIFIISSGGSA